MLLHSTNRTEQLSPELVVRLPIDWMHLQQLIQHLLLPAVSPQTQSDLQRLA
jgi:hypothetical protein